MKPAVQRLLNSFRKDLAEYEKLDPTHETWPSKPCVPCGMRETLSMPRLCVDEPTCGEPMMFGGPCCLAPGHEGDHAPKVA